MISAPSSFVSYRSSPYLSLKHSSYFDVYDILFSPYVGKEIVFVEIGVLNGGSLFMWRSFFGEKARIIGIDLNPRAKRWEEHGFEIYIGSQSDETFWADFKSRVGPIDILLDDGGHTFEQQIVTVEAMLPAIRDGGLLVVEDTHTSYKQEFGAPSRYSFVEYAKNMVDGINYRSRQVKADRPPERRVFSIQFFESFVVFLVDRKRSEAEAVPVSNDGQSLDAKDYRDEGDSQLRLLAVFRSRLAAMKNLYLVGNAARLIGRKLFRSVMKRQNRRLGRFFRY